MKKYSYSTVRKQPPGHVPWIIFPIIGEKKIEHLRTNSLVRNTFINLSKFVKVFNNNNNNNNDDDDNSNDNKAEEIDLPRILQYSFLSFV